MQHHVFISYSRKDAGVMRRLCDDFQARGLAVWTDEGIEPGTPSWKMSIEKAIRESGCLVVILSPDAAQSRWVREEIDFAESQNKPILPVLASGDRASAIPFGLTSAQFVDVRENYESALTSLAGEIRDRLKDVVPIPGTALKTSHATPSTTRDDDELEPTNFFDHVRLLYWLFFQPEQFRQVDRETLPKIAAWIISTLAYTPLVAVILGYSFGTIPVTQTEQNLGLTLVVGGVLCFIGWFTTGWIGWHRTQVASLLLLLVNTVMVASLWILLGGIAGIVTLGIGSVRAVSTLIACLSIGIGLGMAFRLANAVTGALGGIILGTVSIITLFGIQLGIEGGLSALVLIVTAFVVSGAIDRTLKTGKLSWLNRAAAVLYAGNYIAILWLYILGGWSWLAR